MIGLALFLNGPLDDLPLPASCRQVVYVSTAGWAETSGSLRRFSRSASSWKEVGESVPVRLGGKGLGWGDGVVELVPPNTLPVKREGDGRSPAGIFTLDYAFCKDLLTPLNKTFSFRLATNQDFWVDDVTSPDYNTWQHLDSGTPEWRSAESMVTKGPYYDLGVVVGHNIRPIVPGHGSAIFLHLWSRPDEVTSGCTSMSRADMEVLLNWLDERERPLLVQLPAGWR